MRKVIGHNILGFDLPYLHKSNFKYGSLGNPFLNSRGFWNPLFADTMRIYDPKEMISLDNLAKFLGHKEGKIGNGKHFHAMEQEDKEAYLTRDLRLVEFCFEKMNRNNVVCADPIFFDIETAPLPDDEIAELIPPFDPDKVKLGARKKPEVIEEYIEEQRAKHLPSFIDKAGLDAKLSVPVAIGYIINGEVEMHFDDPKTLLNGFWAICGEVWNYNINQQKNESTN